MAAGSINQRAETWTLALGHGRQPVRQFGKEGFNLGTRCSKLRFTMNSRTQIAVSREKIGEFCRRNHIRKLSVFGSVVRDGFRPDSDVDVLVEFETGQGPGYFGLIRMERELAEIMGRKVDLRTPGELSRYFRDAVLSSAEVQYAGN
jgi:predicted nucleotidyltransferase